MKHLASSLCLAALGVAALVAQEGTQPLRRASQRARVPLSTGPDCAGVNSWPTSMAFVHLKNAGDTDNARVDFAKTKTRKLASEGLGRGRYRQVHHVVFTEHSGRQLEAITVNEATDDECSGGDVAVYVISKHLGVE